MRRCWLIIITKGLRVWMPPELYIVRSLAVREARRWVEALSRRHAREDPVAASPIHLRDQVLLHVIETDFEEPWRSCPLWIGIRWSERSYPRLKLELMAADADEALAWIRSQSRNPLMGSNESEVRLECSFERRGVRSHIAAHRVKRLAGF